jgi:hypothetical protein
MNAWPAYVGVCARSATHAELQLLLEAATDPEHLAPWSGVIDRWAPPITDVPDDPAALTRVIARLAADGLWMYESLSHQPLPPAVRERIAAHIAATITHQESTS